MNGQTEPPTTTPPPPPYLNIIILQHAAEGENRYITQEPA